MTTKSRIVITERHQQIAKKWMEDNKTIGDEIMDFSKLNIDQEIQNAADMLMKIKQQETNEINNKSNQRTCIKIWESSKKAA